MESSIISQRCHTGLQQLTALGAVTHSFLGPNKKHKFIQDESTGESSLVCTCFRVVDHIDLASSIGQLVNETIQVHQKVFHSGAGCLLFLAGIWSRAALECLHRGISIPHFMSAMLEGLDICLDVCRLNSVSIEEVRPIVSDSDMSVLHRPLCTMVKKQVTNSSQEALNNTQGRIKLSHSRYFCGKNKVVEKTTPRLFCQVVNSQGVDIPHLAESVSHGCVDMMSLVIQAFRIQSNNDDSCRTFDVNKLVACTLPGLPEVSSCALQGFVVLLSAEQASLVHHIKERSCQVVLINGDLSEKYRHLGFNKPTEVRYVADKSDLKSPSKGEVWEEKVLMTLLNNNVNIVLVSGEASKRFIQRCVGHCIVVVEGVKPAILKDFAETTGAVPVSYATQLSKRCIGIGVDISVWRDCSGSGRRASMAVNLATKCTTLVTVVLSSTVEAKLQALEDQFWGCAYRLHHALKDKKLLRGAGMTEMLCIHHLQKHIKGCGQKARGQGGACVGNLHRDYVIQLMVEGWMDYISTLMLNSGTCSKVSAWTTISQHLRDLNGELSVDAVFSRLLLRDETENGEIPIDMGLNAGKVYDNVSVKLEAWREALDLVFLVLQTDTEIITGIDPKQMESQSHVMVL